MTLQKLMAQLILLSNQGFDDEEVRVICCDDNPIKGEYVSVNGVYAITNHPDKEVDGVYIDGTV